MNKNTYIAFLRGINVGGHKKVPMSRLQSEMQKMGFSGVTTLLNSGNVIFKASDSETEALQENIADHLEKAFGFQIPTQVVTAEHLKNNFTEDPFAQEQVHEKTRLYITFLPSRSQEEDPIPFKTVDGSFRIISRKGNMLCSVLDLTLTMTPDAMALLEKQYGKGITTRNWNTVKKILKQVDSLNP